MMARSDAAANRYRSVVISRAASPLLVRFNVAVRQLARAQRGMTASGRTEESCDRNAAFRSETHRLHLPYVRAAQTTGGAEGSEPALQRKRCPMAGPAEH